MSREGTPLAEADPTSPQPLSADGAARELLGRLDALLAITERETDLVRRGKLSEAAAIADRKSELAGWYLGEMVRQKSRGAAVLSGDAALHDELRQRHGVLRALLQNNLAVLATAHAVAEGLVRGAAAEIGRQSAPQAYGGHGQLQAPVRTAQPVAVSRSC